MNREATVIPIAGHKRPTAELQGRSDDELMHLVSAGLVEAFSVLVHRHERALRSFCSRWLASAAHGDDVAQEVFLEIWRTRHRYDQQGRFRGFLFTAARHRCLKEGRRSQPTGAEIDEGALAASPDAVDAVLLAERRQRLDRLVARLPPKLRDVIWLRYAAELEYGEIAEIVRRPIETVRSRVFHGLRHLRRWARKSESQPEGKPEGEPEGKHDERIWP